MTISGSDILFKYSVPTTEEGSLQSQPTPADSLGGFVSTTTWPGATKHDLFGAISADANAKLVVEYRCVFLVNTSTVDYWFGPKIWLSALPESSDLAIGVDVFPPVARGFDGQQAVKTTGVGILPHGVTFSSPLSQSDGIEVGDLGPGECRAIWLRRTATAAELPAVGDGCLLTTQLKSASVTWDVAASQAAQSITDTRCGPFHSVAVDYMIAGTTRVTWRPRQGFPYKTPFSCQLQVGQTGSHTADDWIDVGPSSTNSFIFTDPERRSTGKQLTTHYRIKMTDADGVIYYSSPSIVLGSLGPRDWLTFREMVRQENLRLKAFAGVRGFLLKKRRSGSPCTRCLDTYTQEATDGKCSVCKGTRFVDGYYRAVPLVFADVSNPELEEQRSQGQEGWGMPSAIKADFVATPHLETGDIWVDGSSDLRYHIDKVVPRGRIRGLPVAMSAVMSQLAFNHEAYAIPLEGT